MPSSITYVPFFEMEAKIEKPVIPKDLFQQFFHIHPVRQLETIEIDRRQKLLAMIHYLKPNPSFGDDSKFPIISFSTSEFCSFLSEELKKNFFSFSFLLTGSGVRHCLINDLFNDVDINCYIMEPCFDFILNLVRYFIECKLKTSSTSLTKDQIDNIYVYRKKRIFENGITIASFIGLGTLEFKFILKETHYRYYVATFEGFLISLFNDQLYYVSHDLDYSKKDHEEAMKALLTHKFIVKKPEEITDLFFRMLLALTHGFLLPSQDELLALALKQFCIDYSLDQPDILIRKIHQHFQNHFPGHIQGQLIEIFNIFTLLENIENSELRYQYYSLICKAWTLEKPSTSKLSKIESTESKEPPKGFFFKPFGALSEILQANPKLISEILTLIHSVIFLENNKTISSETPKSIKGTLGKLNFQFLLTKKPLEKLAIECLTSWNRLELYEKEIQEIFNFIGVRGIAFNKIGRKKILKIWMDVFQRANARLTLTDPLYELITKELSDSFDNFEIEKWHAKVGLKTFIDHSLSKEGILQAVRVILYRLKISSFNPNIEHICQIHVRLKEIKPIDLQSYLQLKVSLSKAIQCMIFQVVKNPEMRVIIELKCLCETTEKLVLFNIQEKKKINSLLLSACILTKPCENSDALFILYKKFARDPVIEGKENSENLHVLKVKALNRFLSYLSKKVDNINDPKEEFAIIEALQEIITHFQIPEIQEQLINTYEKLLKYILKHREKLVCHHEMAWDLAKRFLVPLSSKTSSNLLISLCEFFLVSSKITQAIEIILYVPKETPGCEKILLECIPLTLIISSIPKAREAFRLCIDRLLILDSIQKKFSEVQIIKMRKLTTMPLREHSSLMRNFVSVIAEFSLNISKKSFDLFKRYMEIKDVEYGMHFFLNFEISSKREFDLDITFRSWVSSEFRSDSLGYLINGNKLLHICMANPKEHDRIAKIVDGLIFYLKGHNEDILKWPKVRRRFISEKLLKSKPFISGSMFSNLWMQLQACKMVENEDFIPLTVVYENFKRGLVTLKEKNRIKEQLDRKVWNNEIAIICFEIIMHILKKPKEINESELLYYINILIDPSHADDVSTTSIGEVLNALLKTNLDQFFPMLWKKINHLCIDPKICVYMLQGVAKLDDFSTLYLIKSSVIDKEMLLQKSISSELRTISFNSLFQYLSNLAIDKLSKEDEKFFGTIVIKLWKQTQLGFLGKNLMKERLIIFDKTVSLLLKLKLHINESIKIACKSYVEENGGLSPRDNALAIIKAGEGNNETFCSIEFEEMMDLLVSALVDLGLIKQVPAMLIDITSALKKVQKKHKLFLDNKATKKTKLVRYLSPYKKLESEFDKFLIKIVKVLLPVVEGFGRGLHLAMSRALSEFAHKRTSYPFKQIQSRFLFDFALSFILPLGFRALHGYSQGGRKQIAINTFRSMGSFVLTEMGGMFTREIILSRYDDFCFGEITGAAAGSYIDMGLDTRAEFQTITVALLVDAFMRNYVTFI